MKAWDEANVEPNDMKSKNFCSVVYWVAVFLSRPPVFLKPCTEASLSSDCRLPVAIHFPPVNYLRLPCVGASFWSLCW